MLILTESCGRVNLTLTADWLGHDLHVNLTGGEKPHIGAVALAQPRRSLCGMETSASCSVLTLCGHKEDELARHVALALATVLNTVVCVLCGIHLSAITPDEIREVQRLSDSMVQAVIPTLVDGPPSAM